jgi:predicted amidophosphoribosyltransferase
LDKNKSPRFFCDNCGYEVGNEVKTCPHCGRIFASVRCPACDFTGAEKMFLNGCPMCGYSAEPSKPAIIRTKVKKPKRYSEPLSLAAYIIIGIVVLGAIAILSHFITH